MRNYKYLLLIALFLFYSQIAMAEEAYHDHHVAVFVGATTCTYEHGITSPTIGLDYEYYLGHTSPIFGIGLMVELVDAEHIEYIAAVPAYFHPSGSFKFWLAPGIIEREERGAGGSSEIHEFFMLRIGGDYDMHFGSYTVSPTFSADLVNNEILMVYGVTLGILF